MLPEDVGELLGAAMMNRQTPIIDSLEGGDEIGADLDTQQRGVRRHNRQQSTSGTARARSQLDDIPGGRQVGKACDATL